MLINWCYSRAAHWIPNLLVIPCGKHGKLFIKELTRPFCLYSEDSAIECLALKATFVFPILVLQKPHRRSKVRDHVNALDQWLKLWNDGLFEDLLKKGNTCVLPLVENQKTCVIQLQVLQKVVCKVC